MYVDRQLELSNAQAITVDAPSTDYIDQQAAGRGYDDLWLIVQVPEAFASGAGNGTLTISLRTSPNAAGGALVAPITLFTSRVFTLAELVAGAELIKMRLPSAGLQRYFDLLYTVNGADPFTAGAIDAFLTMDANFGF